ncbi:MAG TPA: ABC transporter ATP-binding protein [Kofleriaceae bacterium]|nr:ABC transporter ATP-binding protein [Kofleriaceae bacterium]
MWKQFGEVVANRDVSLSVARGEVHAVIGENGAGKSTLMRALYGEGAPDRGEVRIGGERIGRPSVAEAIRRKVGMVHQHFMLVPTLTVAENVVLGREPRRGLLLDSARAEAELAELGESYGLAIEPGRLVRELSVGEAQRVEIVKVLWRGADVLILDEPTAVLTPGEVAELFSVLRALVAAGKTVVLVTHKLDEVLALAGRVTVMRRGEVVAALDAKETTSTELARAMLGPSGAAGGAKRSDKINRPLQATAAREKRPRDTRIRLNIEDLRAGRLQGVTIAVREGEVVGVAGVEGNGQTELGLAVAGLLPAAGRVALDGADVSGESVRARQARGLGHIPEDRHGRGLLLDFSVEDNVLLGHDDRYAKPFRIDRRALRRDTRHLIERLDVRPADPRARAGSLSGGNQQKVVVGRELSRRLSALVCAQPTRGVDVGAIERIHDELRAVRKEGVAILLISAELDELLALADRIVVLYRGRIVGERDLPANATDAERAALKTALGALMLGATAA